MGVSLWENVSKSAVLASNRGCLYGIKRAQTRIRRTRSLRKSGRRWEGWDQSIFNPLWMSDFSDSLLSILEDTKPTNSRQAMYIISVTQQQTWSVSNCRWWWRIDYFLAETTKQNVVGIFPTMLSWPKRTNHQDHRGSGGHREDT